MLTSRERCIRAIEHEIPDRTPLILRIRPEPLERLLNALNLSDPESLIRALGVDVLFTGIGLKGGFEPSEPVEWKEGGYVVGYIGNREIRRNIFGVETIWAPSHTHTYTFYRHPLQHMSLDEYPWPDVREEDYDRVVQYRREHGDYFIYGGITSCFETAWKLTGFNEFLRLMLKEPAKAEYILNRISKISEKQAKMLLDAGVDAIVYGDDVGMQHSMIISPRIWRKFLKPIYEKLATLIHKRGGYFVFHSDGWIEPIIPDLIEVGVDVLTPVQPECMDVYKLKELYGSELCLDGTISIQRTLPFGKPEEIEREVKDRIEKLGPTGLILGPGHAIQPEVPLENIITLFKAALKYGKLKQL